MAEAKEYQGVTPGNLEDLRNVDHAASPQVGDALVVTAVDEDGTVHWRAGETQGGSSASPVAVPFTTEEMPNPAGGTDTMTVIVLPADSPVFAIKIEGEAFPRLLWIADDGMYASDDGSTDPYDGPVTQFTANGIRTPGVDCGQLLLLDQLANTVRIVVNGGVVSAVPYP